MTSEKEDARLRWWAFAALALLGLVYVLPDETLKMLVASPDTHIFLRIFVAGILLIGILGFFLRMFFECAFAPHVHRRGTWLLLFILIPIVSAFIYFFVTRSARYKEHVRSLRVTP